jgi:hypothetical protein
LTLVNATGAHAAWYVNVRGSDFVADSQARLEVSSARLRLPDSEIEIINGSVAPESWMPENTILTGEDQLLLQAWPGVGMGTYRLGPRFSVLIPPETSPESYQGNLIFTILAGPW